VEQKAIREGMEVDVRPAGRRSTRFRRRAKIISLVHRADFPGPRRTLAIVEYSDTGEQATVRLGRIVKRP
jgi:hypothetical protein